MAAVELFRTDWLSAKKILADETYAGAIPERDEKILEDWYQIREKFLKYQNVEVFRGQQNEFNKHYYQALDDVRVKAALATISKLMSQV